ncbi:MAG: hypothetical protein QNJ91_13150 [Gammaproteobacteria bacterium]|nr:hypothetical protein [Gammaproteobacteria bacterium]
MLAAIPFCASAATYLYDDNAPYAWEDAATDVVWERRSTRYPVDDDKDVVNIGFSFPFGGTRYTQVRILSNGILQFGADTGLHTHYRNRALPYAQGDRAIFVYWDDLNPARGGTVRYSMHGSAPHRTFVVSWEDLPNYNYTGVYNLQVILYEDGEIKVQYGNGNATGDSATIGVQIGSGDFTQYSFDQANAVDGNTAIVFYTQRPHFALDVQSSVNLCRSNAVNVTVTRHDDTHGVDTAYTGTVYLSATSSAGSWSNVSGRGSLVDLGGGRARYNFTAPDRGQAVLQYSYASPVITNFHVNDGSDTEHHVEDPFLTFRYGLTDNAADDFDSGGFVGNTGSLSWSTDWTEINESDGAGAGDIRVVSSGGGHALRLSDNDGGGEGVYRELDLSGQPPGSVIVLGFDYRRVGLDSTTDYVAVAVSSNGGRSWRELDRFIGPGTDSGFQSETYDISRYAGSNTRIRFLTSSRLGNSDYVYIDNVDIGIRTPSCGIDHYAVSHGGTGVTCEASAVTLSAHDGAHGSAEPGAGTRVVVTAIDTLSGTTATDATWTYTGSGTFAVLGGGTASYTFAAGETQVELWLSRPGGGTVNVNALDGNGAVEAASEDPDLAFVDSALRFYADGVADAIGTQVAGKASTSAPGGQRLSVRAVETDAQTGVCQSRLSGRHAVEFALECVDPSACVVGQVASVEGMAVPGHPAGGVATYQAVDLTFDASGHAPLTFAYSDVGRVVLHARASLPASGQQVATVVAGASNPFVVVPAGLCIEPVSASGACLSGDATCSVLARAGEAFDLDVRAVAWETAGETGADFCSGNPTTPNFRLDDIVLAPTLVAPLSGSVGALGVTDVDLRSGDGGTRSIAQTYSEVGVLRIEATPPAYLGQALATASSANIGRFVPDRFALAGGVLTPGCGSFTYMAQDALGVQFAVEARNAASARTQNYRDAFAKAAWALVAEDSDAGNDLGARLSSLAGSWSAGLLTISAGDVVFARDAVIDGPYDSLQLGVRLVDNDGGWATLANRDMNAATSGSCVAAGNCDAVAIGTTAVRYGRLNIVNAHGSELLDLAVPLRVETYAGSTQGFVVAAADSCTALSTVTLSDLDPGDDLVPTETCVWDALNVTTAGCASPGPPALQFATSPTAGLFNLHLQAPGAGNTGVAGVQVLAPDWLRFDWRGAGDEDPRARATFGIFNRGNQLIYRREVR